MYFFQLPDYKFQWWALVITVKNSEFHKNQEIWMITNFSRIPQLHGISEQGIVGDWYHDDKIKINKKFYTKITSHNTNLLFWFECQMYGAGLAQLV